MTTLSPVVAIERDVKKAASSLGRNEARFLVDTYYSLQDFRISSTNQVRSMLKSEEEEPHDTLAFFGDQFSTLEKQVQGALNVYSLASPLGQWAREHVGVGPVIAAGLLAHIDIERAPSASSVWRYAGLVPGQKKQKGVKRDWNASLKVLCWKLGDSFVKFSGHERCYYGHLYRTRKEYEVVRDARGDNRTAAEETLSTINIKDPATKARYVSGHLPDGRLDMRARRYAVKRFLSHYWEAAWWVHYGTHAPNPYVQEHLGHVHMEPCPVPLPQAAPSE